MLTDVKFWENSAGHSSRISKLIDQLSLITELTIVFVGPLNADLNNFNRINLPFHFLILEKDVLLTPDEYGLLFSNLISKKEIDVCIIEYIHNSYFLEYLPDNVLAILDIHDIIHERTKSFRKERVDMELFDISEDLEFSLFALFDYILVLCIEDFEVVAQKISRSKVILCSHPPNVKNIILKQKVTTIGFIGSEYPANKDAIDYYIRHCWSYIYNKFGIKLNIYGNVCNLLSEYSQYKNITLSGFIEDIEIFYQNIDIVINPVRVGAGIKIKNIETLGYSIPLITSTHGARGIETIAGSGFLIADNPLQMINSTEALIENFELRKRLQNVGRDFILNEMSIAKCYSSLFELLT